MVALGGQGQRLEAAPPRGPALNSRLLALVLVFVAVALRVWQYAAGTSMWMDELWIASNVLPRSTADLLRRPLDFGQVAPPGFLLLTKWSTLALGSTEYALRLLPFLAALASVVLFWRLACRALDGAGLPMAVALFAWNVGLLRYTSEAKQYAVDAAAALALTLLALRLRDRPPTLPRAVAAGAAGLLVVCLSHASALVLAGLGAALAIGWLSDRPRSKALPYAVVLCMWAIAAAVSVLAAVRHLAPSTAAFMKIFWREGFVPWPPVHLSDALWLWNRLVDLFGQQLMQYPWPAAYVLVMLAGFVALWRRRRELTVILVAPLAMTLVAAAAQQYPFSRRLILFLVPVFLIAVAAGIEWLRRGIASRQPALAWAAVVILLVPPAWIIVRMPPPHRSEEYKGALAYVRDHRLPGDRIYVFTWARLGMQFYGPRFGFNESEYTIGGCYRDELRPYLREIDEFRGAPRVWVILASVFPVRQARIGITNYLDAIGVRGGGISYPSAYPFSPDGVFAYLYDLSDSARLAAASWRDFPLEPMTFRPSCLSAQGRFANPPAEARN